LAGCGERLLLLSSIQFSLEKQLHLSKSLSNRRIWIVEFLRRKMALPNFRQSVSNSPGPSMRKSRTKKRFPLNQLDYRNKQIQFQLFFKIHFLVMHYFHLFRDSISHDFSNLITNCHLLSLLLPFILTSLETY
jgi:hypothetical protein